ncbi:hypothetical protein [Pseudomonas sp. NPDC089569]|uniref:hypothetical protein n=1 Tax=Pseudomonas sp. NPDC089569 TaxID=3390722 RepID=UPI003D00F075
MAEQHMSLWTVNDKPIDYPTQFIACRWLATLSPTPTRDILVADDLYSIRKMLPPGLFCIPSSPLDGPSIVETWI